MKYIRLFSMCAIIIFTQNINLLAQDKLLSTKKRKKDLKELKKIFDAHPDPYTHISEKDFNKKWKEVESTLEQPQTTLDFYKEIASLVAVLKDGHSSAYLPSYWMKKQRKKNGAFPYEIHLSNDNQMYIIKKFNDGKIPVGSKILEINGINIEQFLAKIDPFISYEKIRFRNTRIDDNIEKYLYLAFGHSDSTKIKYFTSDTLEITTRNMNFKKWKKFQKNDREEREIKISIGEPYAYKKIAEGVGVISIYSFSTPNYKGYKLFLLKTFKTIKNDNIHSLIIDIRGNYGGWPKVASSLFHYISDSYFKTMARSSMKVSYAYRNNLTNRYPSLRGARPFIPQRRHYLDIAAILGDPYDTFVNEETFFNEKPITKKFEFTGKTYLLSNRDSYSAASSFAATFQCYQMGLIIGEETGGTKIFRANAIHETLTKSGIRVGMSTTKLFNTCFNKEFEGIKPNIEYAPDILQIISGTDTQLIFAQRIIQEIQKLEKEAKN